MHVIFLPGEAQFRRITTRGHHRARSRSEADSASHPPPSTGLIHMLMHDTSHTCLLNHAIHPLTELKPNGNVRSWTWTVSDSVRGSHVTLAVKFKAATGAGERHDTACVCGVCVLMGGVCVWVGRFGIQVHGTCMCSVHVSVHVRVCDACYVCYI